MNGVESRLLLDDAIELGHAWCQRRAQSHGVRVLFLKGPALQRQGLREPQTSGDVDVLVEPARWDAYIAALQTAGWREREPSASASLFSTHSRTFIHDRWPCDVDLHRHYPGLLADPADAFEALWARRTTLDFAHVDCAVPDRLAGIVVLALHSLRGVATQSRHRRELDGLVARARLDAAERDELGRLCRRLGSVATLERVLPALGVSVEPQPWELASPALPEWRGLVHSGANGAYRWLLVFVKAPHRQRPRLLAQALWPSDHDLRVDHPELAAPGAALARARVRRLARGLRAAPAALSAWLRSRRR